jgi:hypothetical protein
LHHAHFNLQSFQNFRRASSQAGKNFTEIKLAAPPPANFVGQRFHSSERDRKEKKKKKEGQNFLQSSPLNPFAKKQHLSEGLSFTYTLLYKDVRFRMAHSI